jgi:hypothetical protein
MTFEDLRREYEGVRIGEHMFARISRIVAQVARRYPPAVYSEITAIAGDWSQEALDALVQAFVTESLLEAGQLEYTMSQAATLPDFDRLTRRQLRRHLRATRRRSVVDNIVDRVRARLGEPPYEEVGNGRWRLVGRETEDRPPHREELDDALARASLVPREASNALERAPRVYGPDQLDTLLRSVSETLACPLALDHVRWVLEQLLTELVPSELLPIHEDMAEDEDSVEYAAWAEANARAQRDAGGDLMAVPEPSPEEAAAVTEAVEKLCSSLDEQQMAILRMKLAGLSDAKVASAVSLSRPTVIARNKAILQRIDEHFSDLDEAWHSRALDQLVRALGDG